MYSRSIWSSSLPSRKRKQNSFRDKIKLGLLTDVGFEGNRRIHWKCLDRRFQQFYRMQSSRHHEQSRFLQIEQSMQNLPQKVQTILRGSFRGDWIRITQRVRDGKKLWRNLLKWISYGKRFPTRVGARKTRSNQIAFRELLKWTKLNMLCSENAYWRNSIWKPQVHTIRILFGLRIW